MVLRHTSFEYGQCTRIAWLSLAPRTSRYGRLRGMEFFQSESKDRMEAFGIALVESGTPSLGYLKTLSIFLVLIILLFIFL